MRCFSWEQIVCCGILLTFLVPANAITDQQINDSINLGVNWLVNQQNAEGYWPEPGFPLGATGLAVTKLEDRSLELGYKKPLDPEAPYSQSIQDGLNYIFKNAHLYDTNGDNVNDSIFFSQYPYSYHTIYETSIAIMAIAGSISPDQIVGQLGSEVDGMSYLKIVELALNYLVYAQTHWQGGSPESGGWSYGHLSQGSPDDSSNTGYAVLGLDYASKKFCLNISQEVKDNLTRWVNFIQCNDSNNPNYGAAGYRTPCTDYYISILETGNLLYEIAFVNLDRTTPNAQNAIRYIESQWESESWLPGWKGPGNPSCPQCNWSNYQATYTAMKGFEAMGIEKINVSGFTDINWFNDDVFGMASAIVGQQNSDGSWNETYMVGGSNTGKILSTTWALLTLEKAVPRQSRVSIEKTADPSVGKTGTDVAFTINVTNSGENLLDPVEVEDTLPAGLTYVPTGTSPTPDSVLNQSGSTTIIWNNVGPLAPKDSTTITLMARIDIDQNANLTNNVRVNGTTPSLCANTTVTNESSAVVTVTIPPTPPAPIKRVKSQPDRNFDSLEVGSDSAIAMNSFMGPKLKTLATNNLEIKKNQDSGDCPDDCCDPWIKSVGPDGTVESHDCKDCCTKYNRDTIKVGSRGAIAFGSASATNNVKVVAEQK